MGSVGQHTKPHPQHKKKGKEDREKKKDPTGAEEQQGKGEDHQGHRCGEANPNQGLGGTSGQRPYADLSKRETDI